MTRVTVPRAGARATSGFRLPQAPSEFPRGFVHLPEGAPCHTAHGRQLLAVGSNRGEPLGIVVEARLRRTGHMMFARPGRADRAGVGLPRARGNHDRR